MLHYEHAGSGEPVMLLPFGDGVLLNAISQAIEGSRTALAHDAELRALRDCQASLTPRERETMALVVSGLLNKQIAAKLGISEITVKATEAGLCGRCESIPSPNW